MKSKSEGLAACLAHGKHPIHIIINFIAKWLISLLVLHFPEALFCILTKLHFHHFPYSCKACFLNQMLPFLWPLYPWPFPLSFFHLSWIWTGSHNTSHFILKEPSEQSFYSCLADHSLHALQNLLLPSLCTLQSLCIHHFQQMITCCDLFLKHMIICLDLLQCSYMYLHPTSHSLLLPESCDLVFQVISDTSLSCP